MANPSPYGHFLMRKMLPSMWELTPTVLNRVKPMPSDIAIARAQSPKPIGLLAREIGLLDSELTLYGSTKAKVALTALDRLRRRADGQYVVVTGITPSSREEGKTSVLMGLTQALCAHKKLNAIACMRQPSLGPTFEIKGGAAGGGYAQVIPMEDLNLHLTGDLYAVMAANNLLAAQLDLRIHHELTQLDEALFDHLVPRIKGVRQFTPIQMRRLKRLGIAKSEPDELTPVERKIFARLDIDPTTIMWDRVADTNDRPEKHCTRKASFSLAGSSEIMAVLGLARSYEDLKERLAKMVVAFDKQGLTVTADDLGITGVLTVLLKDALEPTLMQTLEGTPVLVHTGSYANIGNGCCSIVADEMALKLVDEGGYVCTETGFGSDIGLEKFCNVKCRTFKKKPNAVVLVASVRTLKMHGGDERLDGERYIESPYQGGSLRYLEKGLPNLVQHIKNGMKFGLPVVVAINNHSSDTMAEHNLIKDTSLKAGAFDAVTTTHWSDGGLGALDLANAVTKACKSYRNFELLYPNEMSLLDKMHTIAENMYGAEMVRLMPEAEAALQKINDAGFSQLPICMLKTPNSLTDDPKIKGAPKGFILTVRHVYLNAGAGYVVAQCGDISNMPGLSMRPRIYDIDLNTRTGEIEGLC